jgi:hypothetical protein
MRMMHGSVFKKGVNKLHGAKIPNICEHFNVKCVNLEKFMEVEGWSF